MAEEIAIAALKKLGGEPVLRMQKEKPEETFVTDNGAWVLDVSFPDGIDDPFKLQGELEKVPGLVSRGEGEQKAYGHGLFLNLAEEVVVAGPNGVETLTPAQAA